MIKIYTFQKYLISTKTYKRKILITFRNFGLISDRLHMFRHRFKIHALVKYERCIKNGILIFKNVKVNHFNYIFKDKYC